MNDLDSKIAEGIDDEALFRLAEGEAREFSPEYRQSVERLYRRAGAHPKRRMRPIRRIIAFAAIVAVLTGAAAAATFWEEIQQFFVTTFGQYATLETDSGREVRKEDFVTIPEDWDSFWCPKDLDGYIIAEAESTKKQKIIIFENGVDEYKLYQWHEKANIYADSEAAIVSGIYVGDKEVYAIEKELNGKIYRTIFWTIDKTYFKLYGTLSFHELSKIASDIVFIER